LEFTPSGRLIHIYVPHPYEYVCCECFAIVLNIYRANPGEREKRAPGTALD
jgi:hypothetical protein